MSTLRSWLRPALAVSLLLAAAAIVAVDTVAAAVAAAAPTGLLGRPFLLLAASVLGVAVLRGGVSMGSDGGDEADDWLPETPPERAGGSGSPTAGGEIDALLASLADPRDEEYPNAAGRRSVRSRVEGLAAETVADAVAVDPAEVERQLGTGQWTGEPRAAAFFGADGDVLLRTRVADWLAGKRFERRLAAAVDEISVFAGTEPRDGAVIEGSRRERIDRVRRAAMAHAAVEDAAAPAIDARELMTAHGRSVDDIDELPELDPSAPDALTGESTEAIADE